MAPCPCGDCQRGDDAPRFPPNWQRLIPAMSTLTSEEYARVTLLVEAEGVPVFNAVDQVTGRLQR